MPGQGGQGEGGKTTAKRCLKWLLFLPAPSSLRIRFRSFKESPLGLDSSLSWAAAAEATAMAGHRTISVKREEGEGGGVFVWGGRNDEKEEDKAKNLTSPLLEHNKKLVMSPAKT